MARGINGIYIYTCDDNLKEQLKKDIIIKNNQNRLLSYFIIRRKVYGKKSGY